MAIHPYVTVDVFTERPFAGNPLAVVTDARGLGPEQMQAIAAEFGYPESTFVFPPDDPAHTARVRIFTPRREIPFAGHPNVGTAFVVARLAERSGRPPGSTLLFEEGAGLVAVDLLREGGGRTTGAVLTAPQALSLGATVPADVVAACAGLAPGAVRSGRHEPVVASVGLPFVVAEVAVDAIGAARPDLTAFTAAARHHASEAGWFSLFLYARVADRSDGADLRARMFAPLGGIMEDPATGSANGALVALLAQLEPGPDARLTLDVRQGVEMGRPSLLSLSAEKRAGVVTRVRVGGRCAPVTEGTLEV